MQIGSKLNIKKMERGKEIKKKEIYGKYSILGGEKFRESVLKKIDTSHLIKDVREKPNLKHIQSQTLKASNIIEIIVATFNIEEQLLFENKRNNVYRKLFLYCLRKYTSLNLREIGVLLEMDYCAVFQSQKRFFQEAKNNKDIAMMLGKFEKEFLNFKSKVTVNLSDQELNVKC